MPRLASNSQNIKNEGADQSSKIVPHPTASTFCLCFTAVIGDSSFSKLYLCFTIFVKCYKAHFVIKVLSLWAFFTAVLAYYTCTVGLCI
jgi:hypothetical protein